MADLQAAIRTLLKADQPQVDAVSVPRLRPITGLS